MHRVVWTQFSVDDPKMRTSIALIVLLAGALCEGPQTEDSTTFPAHLFDYTTGSVQLPEEPLTEPERDNPAEGEHQTPTAETAVADAESAEASAETAETVENLYDDRPTDVVEQMSQPTTELPPSTAVPPPTTVAEVNAGEPAGGDTPNTEETAGDTPKTAETAGDAAGEVEPAGDTAKAGGTAGDTAQAEETADTETRETADTETRETADTETADTETRETGVETLSITRAPLPPATFPVPGRVRLRKPIQPLFPTAEPTSEPETTTARPPHRVFHPDDAKPRKVSKELSLECMRIVRSSIKSHEWICRMLCGVAAWDVRFCPVDPKNAIQLGECIAEVDLDCYVPDRWAD